MDIRQDVANESITSVATNKLHAEAMESTLAAHRSYLVTAMIAAGKQVNISEQTSVLVGELAKTAALFYPGVVGKVAYVGLSALDQAHPGDSTTNQLIDAGLGAAKGLLLREAFAHAPSLPGGLVTRAVGLGITSRILESGLNRQMFIDSATGTYDFAGGAGRVARSAFNPMALASDVATFAIAGATVGGIDKLTGGAISRTPFYSTVATGSIMGAISGASQPIQRSVLEGRPIQWRDFSNGSISGAFFGAIAAIPAGIAIQHSFNLQLDKNLQAVNESNRKRWEKNRPSLTTNDSLGWRGIPNKNIAVSLNDGAEHASILSGDSNHGKLLLDPGEGTKLNGRDLSVKQQSILKVGDKLEIRTADTAGKTVIKSLEVTADPQNGQAHIKGLTFKENGFATFPKPSEEFVHMRTDANGKVFIRSGKLRGAEINGKRLPPSAEQEIRLGDKIAVDFLDPGTNTFNAKPLEWRKGNPEFALKDRFGDYIKLDIGPDLGLEINSRHGSNLRLGADEKGPIYSGGNTILSAGRITVNGKPVRFKDDFHAFPTNKVRVDGRLIQVLPISEVPYSRRLHWRELAKGR